MGAYQDVENLDNALEIKHIEANKESQEQAIEQAGFQVQVVNWVYEQVTGENLVESLIRPIAGDFSRIEQNAKAWEGVGKALQAVRKNLNNGISELREHWHGSAANATEALLVTSWTVALEADAKLAQLVGKAFTKAADFSRKMCDKALDLIKQLVDRLIETAATGWIPVAGWANVVRNVEKCVEIVMAAKAIYDALTNLYNTVVELVDKAKALGTDLMKVKDVRSLGDAVNLGMDIKDDYAGFKEQDENVGKATQEYDKAVEHGAQVHRRTRAEGGYTNLARGTLHSASDASRNAVDSARNALGR